jgi:hypothetical protein
MKHPRVLFAISLVVLACAIVSGAFAKGALRAGRVGASLRLGFGRSSADSIAQIGAEAEYGLLEKLSLGMGYAYVDGNMTQENCLEVLAKGYLLGKPLDIFAAAAIFPARCATRTDRGFRSSATSRYLSMISSTPE